MTKAVLVGLRPETDSLATITWAAECAGRLRAPLRVVLTDHARGQQEAYVRALYEAAATVRDHLPRLSLFSCVTDEDLTGALIDRSTDAQLAVVAKDPHRRGIATTVASRAACPIAAVAPDATWTDDNRPILIGADGTDYSEQALRWAFAEADQLGCGVRILHCQPHGPAGANATQRRNSVFDLVALFAGRHPATSVQLHTLYRPPAETLAWHSQFASMVVIGHHDHTVGGRIYRAVLREAACPVVIAGPNTSLGVASASSTLDTVRS